MRRYYSIYPLRTAHSECAGGFLVWLTSSVVRDHPAGQVLTVSSTSTRRGKLNFTRPYHFISRYLSERASKQGQIRRPSVVRSRPRG